MPKDIETIKQEIEDFKNSNGGEYEDYYIGITKHIEQRLIESNPSILEHLQKGEYTEGSPTYSVECNSRDEAVEIEQHFQGEPKGMLKLNKRARGRFDSKYLYCYKIDEENRKAILSENSEDAKIISKNIKNVKDWKNFNR